MLEKAAPNKLGIVDGGYQTSEKYEQILSQPKLALDVYQTVEPYQDNSWVKMPIEDLDPDDIEQRFRKMKGQANTARNTFEMMRLPKPKGLAESMLKTLENFEQWIRIIRALNTEGLKKKHIDKIN